jgi:hypothetical protein
MLIDIANQATAAERLLEKADRAEKAVRLLRSGDPVWTPLVAEVEFLQGSAASANMVFNVPADADFWAYRFTLYPYCKVIDPVNGTNDEATYRPTSFTAQPFSPGFNTLVTQFTDIRAAVDCVFAFIVNGKELQNSNIPGAAAYSTSVGKWSGIAGATIQHQWGGSLQTPGGLVFPIPWFVPRTKSVTCRVTPTYLGTRTITDVGASETTYTRQHKYKIVGVLEGTKRVGAFR